jgi:hypothetical protein
MSGSATAVVVLLAAWFALTVANQLQRPNGRPPAPHEVRLPWPLRLAVAGAGSLQLLPRYRFFAPDPLDIDFHIVYRDVRAAGPRSAWQEVPFPRPRHTSLLRPLWNPSHRDHVAVLDSVRTICLLADAVVPACPLGTQIIAASFPYLFVLHQVMRMGAEAGVVGRQLMVVETTGSGAQRSLNLGIASEVHRLDEGCPSWT